MERAVVPDKEFFIWVITTRGKKKKNISRAKLNIYYRYKDIISVERHKRTPRAIRNRRDQTQDWNKLTSTRRSRREDHQNTKKNCKKTETKTRKWIHTYHSEVDGQPGKQNHENQNKFVTYQSRWKPHQSTEQTCNPAVGTSTGKEHSVSRWWLKSLTQQWR